MRYDRLGVTIDAWTTLAASVICFRILRHDIMKSAGYCQSFFEYSPRSGSDCRVVETETIRPCLLSAKLLNALHEA
jgi:hypothetical protein